MSIESTNSSLSIGSDARKQRLPKALLAVGLASFIIAIESAHGTPATGYELSIYQSTPPLFWISIGTALLVGLIVPLQQVTHSVRTVGLTLGGLATIAIAGLPLLRGYFFYGSGDSLSHLGFAKVFVSGSSSSVNLLHPGVHLISIFLEVTSGTNLRWAFMLTVVVFFLVFIIFVPLTVRAITGSNIGFVVGLFAALLLLPINNVSVHPTTHPTSQAILFFPFTAFLLINYITQPQNVDPPVTSIGILLALSSVGIILIHPQQAVNVLLVFGSIIALQFVARHVPGQGHRRFASHHKMYTQTIFLAAVLFIWAPRSERTTGTVNALLQSLIGGAPVGDEITQRGGSLEMLGGSIEELFLKLFAVNLVFAIIVGLFVLLSLTGRFDRWLPEQNTPVKYLGLSLVPVFGMLTVYFLASATTQHFRHLGFMMAIATLIGAVAITTMANIGRSYLSWSTIRVLIVVMFVLLLPLSFAALHSSPYIYQDNSMVSKSHFSGYETSFEYRDPAIAYASIRGGPTRYVDAILGRTPEALDFPGREDMVPEGVFNNGTYEREYETERYIAIAARDYKREVVLFEGFRYNRIGFERASATPDLNRIQSNGELDIYLFSD